MKQILCSDWLPAWSRWCHMLIARDGPLRCRKKTFTDAGSKSFSFVGLHEENNYFRVNAKIVKALPKTKK